MSVIKLKIQVAQLTNVLDSFDRIQVHRSVDGVDGTYTELTTVATRIPLAQGIAVYLYDDLAGDPTYWYKTRYYHSSTGLESALSDPRRGEDFEQNSLIISVQELKDVYLFGLDLTDDAGNPYPDIMYEWSINFAIDWLEKELDIKVRPTVITGERYDYYRADYVNWVTLKLRQSPVISVESLKVIWPSNQEIITFNSDWIKLRRDSGQVNIIPAAGSLSQVVYTAGGSFLPLLASGRDWIPDLFEIDYTAGFAEGELPMDLRELIGKKATFGPLNVAGDLLGGAGIASQSVSIDGLSTSFNTTSSATNAGYGARILQYERELKGTLPMLRRYYKGIRLLAG
ncbi:MAG: hypothetical protein KJN79_01170 [Gammaproteobacteria bacterium]|nr:hypothetical protein [Gammaproteobacteria bacterium]